MESGRKIIGNGRKPVLRHYTAWLAILFSILPFVAKNTVLVIGLGHEGFESGLGWPGDIYALILEGALCLTLSGTLLCIVRWLMGRWPKALLVVLGTFLFVEIIQDTAMVISATHFEKYEHHHNARTDNNPWPSPEVSELPTLKGTVFFGGAGMMGEYNDDMVQALTEAGLANVRPAHRALWSKGNLLVDTVSVLFENNRDTKQSDLSDMNAGGNQFNLVGYSYGSLQAAQAAADYADHGGNVDHLVLIASPINHGFLAYLQHHANIGAVIVIDLLEYGDSIKAGMSDWEIVKAAPALIIQFNKGRLGAEEGHFYFSDEGEAGKQRRRLLAHRLAELGLR